LWLERKIMNRRVALVTGVSRFHGIGRAICLELAKRDIDIFFTYWMEYDQSMPWEVGLNEPALIEEEILQLGVRCERLEVDLSLIDSIELLLSEVRRKLGSPQILINNATYSTSTSIDDITAEELDQHYKVNQKATTMLTVKFIREFQFSSGGRVVNLTSGQSLGPMPGEIAYAITKAAVETLTTTLSHEAMSRGITINAVNPGPNDTNWMSDEVKKQLIKQFPAKRLGLPSDTAKLVGFLVDGHAEWITGQIIHSEGGFIR